MRLLFFVMNKTDKLEKLLTEFLQAGIKGSDSTLKHRHGTGTDQHRLPIES